VCVVVVVVFLVVAWFLGVKWSL